jgi:hypothetical protein
MMKKIVSTLLFISIIFSCLAQTAGYSFKADIVSVPQSGFYNIVISPEINSLLKTDYSDLRILNNSGKWVPHVLRVPATERTDHNAIWDLDISKNGNNPTYTELIIRSDKMQINNLLLQLKNTAVERFGDLSGSDDSTRWFVVNDSILLSPYTTEDKNLSSIIINFPPNSYKFYKLVVHNKGKAPYNFIDVKSVGSAAVTKGQPFSTFIENPLPVVKQKDSAKFSYITVHQKAPYQVSKIALKIGGTKYFKRSVDLFVHNLPRHNAESTRPFESFVLTNNSQLEFSLPVFKDSTFYLVVNNEDNLPLQIEEIRTYSPLHLATAFLEKGNAYSMIMGNANASMPNYDLQKNDIDPKKDTLTAATGSIQKINAETSSNKISWLNNKWLLWLVVAAAAVTLAFFTFKLANDVKKKDTPLT